MKKIEIDWVDSMATSGWHSKSLYDEYETEATDATHHSVGWLLKDLDDRYVIMQSWGEGTGMVDSVLEIPKVSVIKAKTWK